LFIVHFEYIHAMAALKERFLTSIEPIAGERLHLTPAPASRLPLFLRERYTILSTTLFGQKTLLAFEADGWNSGSPAEYRKHAEMLKMNLGAPVVLVLPVLPSHARNRMAQMGIPFIVPGSQVFIPNTLLDLRERFSQPNSKGRETLSPAAQCTLLYHLLRESLAGISLKDIAQKVHYSPMMMTKVKDELEAADICTTTRSGRSMALEFKAAGRSLWDRVQSHLTSPVKKTRWIHWEKPTYPALLAGMSALSRRTLITDDPLPTYALPVSLFQAFLEKGTFMGCRDAETATARMEVWSYNPHLLGDNQMVDPLSLYLSLRYSADERVHQQLEQLIDGIKW
jgi:DNA-binding MarR family transcriptional regulator